MFLFTCLCVVVVVLQSCAEVVVESCRSYIREVKSESVVIIVSVLEHMTQLFPSHTHSLLSPVLPRLLTDTLDEVVMCVYI